MYSNQPGENSTQQSDHPLVCVSKPLSVFIFVIYAAVFFLGVFGNFLVIFIVSRDSKLHTPFNYLVVNLAVSDTFVLLFSLPIVVFSECFSWPFDEFLCKLSRPSFLIFTGVSVCTMVALSFERYQAIVHPLALKMTCGRAFFIIVFVWVLSCFAFGLPRFFVFGLTTEKGILQCDPIKQSFAIRTVTKIFRLIMTLILPCIVVSWAYSRVMRKLRNELAFIADAFASRDIERMRTMRNIKTMRLLVIIIVVFVVCFLPFNIVTSFGSLPVYAEWHYNETIENMSRMFQVSHSCFNPMILCSLGSEFQKALKELCVCLLGKNVLKSKRKAYVLPQIRQSRNSTSPANTNSFDSSL